MTRRERRDRPGPGSRLPGALASVARPGAVVAGALALLAVAFVLAGILLPGTVEVTRTVDIEATPEAVFPLLDDLEAWVEWTPWGAVESRLEGPAAGAGARRVWDDPELGSGSLALVESRPPRGTPGRGRPGVDYLVEVEGGTIRFRGTITVESRPGGSLVTWTERADLGWNPLLGWTALGMEESQGRQLRDGLDRLKALLEGGDPPRP
ncbi:MAG: SRPBCC family protein [Gemmatimonadota bacterium]|nr:SRPBCC family protein [Gemmatimonadota bacterium]